MTIENQNNNDLVTDEEATITSPDQISNEPEKRSLRDSRRVRTLVGVVESTVGVGSMMLSTWDLVGQDRPELPFPSKIALGVVGLALFMRGKNTIPPME